MCQASLGSRRVTGSQSSGLFGALVHSRVSSINVQLDIPDLPDSADVVIPTFRKPYSMEVGRIIYSKLAFKLVLILKNVKLVMF